MHQITVTTQNKELVADILVELSNWPGVHVIDVAEMTQETAGAKPHRVPRPQQVVPTGSVKLRKRSNSGNARKRWTDEDDKQLREMNAAGKSLGGMARALKRSKSSIYNRLGRLDLKLGGDAE